MTDNPIPPGSEYLTSSQAEDIEKKKKRRDFWLGFIGSILLNLILGGLLALGFILVGNAQIFNNPSNATGILATLVYVLPWVVNIAAIIFALVIRRPSIVLGILASYAAGFVLSLCAGLVLMVVCLGQYNG